MTRAIKRCCRGPCRTLSSSCFQASVHSSRKRPRPRLFRTVWFLWSLHMIHKSPRESENAEKSFPMKRIQSATVLGSLTGGLFSSRTGVLQALLH